MLEIGYKFNNEDLLKNAFIHTYYAYEQKKDIDKALEYYYLYSGIETNENMLTIVNQKIEQLEK